MHHSIPALFLAGILFISGCPTSQSPIPLDAPTGDDTAPVDLIRGDVAGVDTVSTDTPTLRDTHPADTHPADLPDPCADLDCEATCALDEDCGMGNVCIFHHDGCCSECVPFCELCSMSAGTYCPGTPPDDLCELGLLTVTEVGPCWFEVEYASEEGTDVLVMDGCMDHIENLPLNGCGLEYDYLTDTFEVACNWCGPVPYTQAACDTSLVELTPLCVHAPHLVGAGSPFPVAIYGQTGCAAFHHAEVEQDGVDVDITLWGTVDPLAPCEEHDACGAPQWIYTGLVWAEAPNPGPYNVTVAGVVHQIVGASGGIIAEPACQDDCAWPELETFAWSLDHLSGADVQGMCSPPDVPEIPGTKVLVTGGCQDFSFSGPDWPFPSQALHCNDGEVFFGGGAPYTVDARVCDMDPLGITTSILLLGIARDWSDPAGGAQLFALHGLKQ